MTQGTQTRIDVLQELAEAPLRSYHIFLGVMIALVLFFDGYDLYNAGYIVHFVTGPWGLNPSKIGLLLSSGLAGFATGSLLSGPLADRFGRRGVLLAGCWGSALMSLAIAVFAHSLMSYIALRLVMGLALGLLMPIAVTYTNELAPKNSSNFFTVCFFSLGWLGGATSAGLLAARLTPHYGWQSLYYVGAGALVFALLLQFVLPESVRFLVSRERWDEVRTLLTRLRPDRKPVYAQAEFFSARTNARPGSVAELLTPAYRLKTLCFWCAGCLSLFASYGLTGWMPTILIARGENISTSFVYASLISAASAVSGITGGFIADRLGDRRPVLWVYWALGAVATAILALATDHAMTFMGVLCAGAFIVGPQTVLNNLVATSYPTEIRSTGMGTFLGLGRFGAMFGPVVAGLLQQWSGGPGIMFVVIGISMLLAATLLFFTAPAKSAGLAASAAH